MAVRLPRVLPRGPHTQCLFNGASVPPPPSPLTLYRQPTMRFNFRRRRSPDSFRREIHSQQRQKTRKPQSQKGMQWFSIPLSVGVGVVGLVHLYRSYRTSSSSREDEKERSAQAQEGRERPEIPDEDSTGRPKKRPRIRPDGPW